MARIRTVKPELAKHEGLFELEQATGYPIRFVWAMLPSVCCREGRFKWRPRMIKSDILPYDDIDFALVLDALLGAGFIRQYERGGELYGYIPTFLTHQRPNKREAASTIPDPDLTVDTHARTCTHLHAPGEGKGREGNGREEGSPPRGERLRVIGTGRGEVS